jgi:tetratricopeptide (TPR) repeat protein
MRKLFIILLGCLATLPALAQPTENLLHSAQQLFNQGMYEESKRLYGVVLQNDPERYIAAYRLAEIYEHEKDYRRSLAYLNTAMDIARRYEQVAREDTTGMAEEWDQLKFDERLAMLYHYQGSLRNRLGEPYRALESFEQSETLTAPSASLLTDKGISYAQTGRSDEAEELYIRAIRTDSTAEEGYYNLAILKQQEQNYAAADSLLALSLKVAPNAVQGWLLSGNLRLEQEKYKEVIAYYDTAATLSTVSEEAFFQRAVAYSRLQDPEQAEKDWTKALSINPDNGNSYRNRGIVRLRQEKFESAEEDFDKAFEILGPVSDLYLNRGYARMMLERPGAALEDFEVVLEADPASSDVYLLAAAAHKALENKDKACQYYHQAIDKGAEPKQVEKWFRKKCR